jgi:hypothetical protein
MPCHNHDEVNGVVTDHAVTPTINDLLMDKEYKSEYL